MAVAGLGTDTGGSCRIPAAFCGIVGYKPTARRVPIAGVLPLAPVLDSVGPLAPSVACCADDRRDPGRRDARALPTPRRSDGPAAGGAENVVLDGMDATVAAAFERALSTLSAPARASRTRTSPRSTRSPAVNAKGGFAASEAYAWHRALLAAKGAGYDPRIRVRIARGEHMSAADYLDLVAARAPADRRFDRARATSMRC